MTIKNFSIGHVARGNTGLSVFLFPKPSACAYLLCGSAPATRDICVLNDGNLIETVDAIVFTGGSAYGLSAADGVMHWLRERGRGFEASTLVPIVPTAAIYDLADFPSPPTAEEAYQACENATENVIQSGKLGAGTGALVGKLWGIDYAMSGGFGSAELSRPDGLIVQAFAVVNCVGDVVNHHGEIIAGARHAKHFMDTAASLRDGKNYEQAFTGQNTTLVTVVTNAKLSKSTLQSICKMAIGGFAQSISPAFTCFDGDIIFCVSNGEIKADALVVGTLAQEAVRQAIVNAIVL